ncbi:MAG: DMT family transporter [Gammaproteobacteria bacterium]|nr:DMT family transporter [Gammaproteobacteria bacterium]
MLSKSQLHFFPVLSLLFSAAMWGVIWYPLRLLEESGLGGLWATLVMYGVASLVGLWLIRGHWHELRRHPWLLIVLMCSNAWCNVAFILAVLDGQVVRVILLFFLSPIWSILLGMAILGERLDRMATITLILALLGAAVMLWEPSIGMPWPRDLSEWLAISAGMGFALANVMARKMQDVSVSAKTAITWFAVTLLAFFWLLFTEVNFPETSFATVGYAAMLGLFGVVLMTLAVLYGVTHMPVSRSAVILLFEIVVGAVSSQLLSDEVIQMAEWVGGGLIVLAAYLSTRSHLNEQKFQNK